MMLFVDGFTHYNSNAFLAQKWDVVADSNNAGVDIVQSLGVGRFGGGGVTFSGNTGITSNLTYQYTQKNYDGVTTIVCGMALKQTSTQQVGTANSGSGARWLSFMSGATLQVGLMILPSGQLRAISNIVAGQGFQLNVSGSPKCTTLGTSTNAISSSSFDFLEVKVIHNPTTGSIEVKRNGAAFWTLSNVNTDIAGTTNSSSVIVGGYNATPFGVDSIAALNAVVCDFYLLNTTVNGSDANDPVDFIGDRHWETLTPTADGFYTAWTPTGSASHFANIDEIPPSTADYNSTTTVNASDTFVVQDSVGITTASAIVCLTMYIEKTTGGANEVKGLARLAGTDRLATAFQVPSPVAFRQSFSCTDPAGNVWTVANYNSSEQGYRKTV